MNIQIRNREIPQDIWFWPQKHAFWGEAVFAGGRHEHHEYIKFYMSPAHSWGIFFCHIVASRKHARFDRSNTRGTLCILLSFVSWDMNTILPLLSLLFVYRWFIMTHAVGVQDNGTACSDLSILQLGTI
jgi:hypothetical protein